MEDTVLQDRYRALLKAARNLFSLTNLDDVVEQIIKHSLIMMQAEACSMYLPDNKTRELIIYSARGGEDVNFHSVRIPWDKGIAGLVFQGKEPVRIDDAFNDPRVLRSMAEKSGFVTRALLTIPLIDKDNCLGVLQAINPLQNPTFTEDNQEIFEAFAGIVTSALLRLEREKRAAAEAMMARELSLAGEIQKSFMPPEQYITRHSELRVRYQPARTIGGDFYAAIPGPDDSLLVAIGDVSGKGIPAALTTAQVTSEMNALTGQVQHGLRKWVRTLNQNLAGRLAPGHFVATTFLLYAPKNATMEVLCAGQFQPWRWRGANWEPVSVPGALPLGVFKNYAYEAASFPCEPGEKWLLFSDGISEGRNERGEDYGDERLRASLAPGHPQYVIDQAWARWGEYVDAEHLHDDACLALLATRPEPELETQTEASSCKYCRKFIESWSLFAGYDDIVRGQIVLALDEAFTNVIRHTHNHEKGHKIQLRANISDNSLHISLRDFGPPLELGKLKGRALGDVKPGGLGLHLLKAAFPTIKYVACDPGTELQLAKPLPGN
jgi:sigma-B regulation protein RsbU (phosphoserine phosphatase)